MTWLSQLWIDYYEFNTLVIAMIVSAIISVAILIQINKMESKEKADKPWPYLHLKD